MAEIHYRLLKLGDRDIEGSAALIVPMQNKLIELGYLDTAADGVYGQNTHDAVYSFQQTNGMSATGTADVQTLERILTGTDLLRAPVKYNSESVIYSVQEKLVLWGFLVGSVDGVSGAKTNQAIQDFKQYLDTSYYELYPTPAPSPTPAPTPSSGFADALVAVDVPVGYDTEITEEIMAFVRGEKEFSIFNKEVQSGDTGSEVWRVQRRLKQLNYLYTPDGSFGTATLRSLLYFQKRNNLPQTGIADELTQRTLFSEDAVESPEYIFEYKLVVDISDQTVYVYQWDGSSYTTLIGQMLCSTGEDATPTPLGTYQAVGRSSLGEWYYFQEFDCYAKWGYYIVGGIMFHSVIYTAEKQLITSSVYNLGTKASHGCIRLAEDHAKWICDNCVAGTTIVIQE